MSRRQTCWPDASEQQGDFLLMFRPAAQALLAYFRQPTYAGVIVSVQLLGIGEDGPPGTSDSIVAISISCCCCPFALLCLPHKKTKSPLYARTLSVI